LLLFIDCKELVEKENKLRELYYGLFKKLPYRHLIYISLAELIINEIGNFQGNIINIKKKDVLKKTEKKILEKIYLHDYGKLFPSDLENWFEEIKYELLKNNYLKKHFIFGYKYTSHFKKNVKLCIGNDFNSNIIKFINTRDIRCLKPIIINIENIKIPKVDANLKSACDFRMDNFKWNNKNMAIRGNTLYLKDIEKIK
jgi:hypothetical protein